MMSKNVEFTFKVQINGTIGAINTAKNYILRELNKLLEKAPYFADWRVIEEPKER